MKLELTSETLCIGKTPDSRAVWKNKADGQAFISVHDAKGVQHLFPLKKSQYHGIVSFANKYTIPQYQRIAKPYTRGSLE